MALMQSGMEAELDLMRVFLWSFITEPLYLDLQELDLECGAEAASRFPGQPGVRRSQLVAWWWYSMLPRRMLLMLLLLLSLLSLLLLMVVVFVSTVSYK